MAANFRPQHMRPPGMQRPPFNAPFRGPGPGNFMPPGPNHRPPMRPPVRPGFNNFDPNFRPPVQQGMMRPDGPPNGQPNMNVRNVLVLIDIS